MSSKGKKIFINIHPIYLYMNISGFIMGLGAVLFNIYMIYLFRYSLALFEASFIIGFSMGLGLIGIVYSSIGLSGIFTLYEKGIKFYRVPLTLFVPFSKLEKIKLIYNKNIKSSYFFIFRNGKSKRYEFENKLVDKFIEFAEQDTEWRPKIEIEFAD